MVRGGKRRRSAQTGIGGALGQRVEENHERDSHILDRDKEILAVRREGKASSSVVRERNRV